MNRDSLIGNEDATHLLGGAGAGSGNDLNNVLVRLSGFGILQDGGDHDTCFDDRSADQVVESPHGGTDIGCLFADFVMGAHVENLTLFGGRGLVGTGNAFANLIEGTAYNDTIYGGGNDSLYGSDRIWQRHRHLRLGCRRR